MALMKVFLLLITCFNSITSVVSSRRDVLACEHSSVVLNCPANEVIRIIDASYGRKDKTTCPHPSIRTTNCHSQNSVSVVRSRCDGQQTCTVHASNSVFGDPCVYTYKYLQVSFECTKDTQSPVEQRTVCEGRHGKLECSNNRVLEIISATYGRLDRTTCPHSSIHTTSCNTNNPLQIIKRKCDRQRTCTVESSNSLYGDPCWGTYKYLTVNFRCIEPQLPQLRQIVCEGKTGQLQCFNNKVLKITDAKYGRLNRETCPHSSILTTNCNTNKPFEIVPRDCDGKRTCTLISSNSVYGDPCRGTYKYLTVSYECIDNVAAPGK